MALLPGWWKSAGTAQRFSSYFTMIDPIMY